MPQESFSQLLRKARQGDPAARESLFRRCRSYLEVLARGHLSTWIQPKVDPSDVVQQTLLEAFQDLDRFAGRSEQQWRAWLRQILARNAADLVRHYRGTAKRDPRRERPLQAAATGQRSSYSLPLADREPTPSQVLVRWEEELQVAEAILRLPEDYQEVIRLRHFQQLPFDQVAQAMGRSRPAVQMLWLRAVRRLAQVMKVQNSGDG